MIPGALIALYLLVGKKAASIGVESSRTVQKWKERLFSVPGEIQSKEAGSTLNDFPLKEVILNDTSSVNLLREKPAIPRACRWSSLDWAEPEKLVSWSAHRNLSSLEYSRDGDLRLHIAGCDLSWVTHQSAKECLAATGHLAIVGDSVSRFLYLSLVNFLHTGLWDPPSNALPLDAPRWWIDYSVAEPRLDVDEYLRATAVRMGGYEICDCFIDRETHMENRYYEEGGVKVSYATFFSHGHAVYFHNPAWLNASCGSPPCKQRGCAVASCNPAESPPGDTLKLSPHSDITAWGRLLSPDTLLFNAGLHASLTGEKDIAAVKELVGSTRLGAAHHHNSRRGDLRRAWDSYMTPPSPSPPLAQLGGASQAAPPPPPPRFVWRTTTPRRWELGVNTTGWGPSLLEGGGGGQAVSPPPPWPRHYKREEAETEAVVEGEGGLIFHAHAILWPLLVMAAQRHTESSAPFSHHLDGLHFSPGVNAELNRAFLTLLCEDWLVSRGK